MAHQQPTRKTFLYSMGSIASSRLGHLLHQRTRVTQKKEMKFSTPSEFLFDNAEFRANAPIGYLHDSSFGRSLLTHQGCDSRHSIISNQSDFDNLTVGQLHHERNHSVGGKVYILNRPTHLINNLPMRQIDSLKMW